jgi:hypothetical protein
MVVQAMPDDETRATPLTYEEYLLHISEYDDLLDAMKEI